MYPDTQEKQPEWKFKLTKVGLTNIKKPIIVKRDGKTSHLIAVIDIYVNLPGDKKGVHMSRNIEAINEVIYKCIKTPVKGIEDLCVELVKELLKKHTYATNAYVQMQSDYFLTRKTPSGKNTLEPYELISKVSGDRKKIRKMIGVRVKGMSVCPCTLEYIKKLKYKNLTHNQRNITTLMLEIPENCDVDANDLIDIVEDSISSPSYEILKRIDEAEVVLKAYTKPMFVEDIVRKILAKIIKKYNHLPNDTLVFVSSESEESIHKHNAYAERYTTLGELK